MRMGGEACKREMSRVECGRPPPCENNGKPLTATAKKLWGTAADFSRGACQAPVPRYG